MAHQAIPLKFFAKQGLQARIDRGWTVSAASAPLIRPLDHHPVGFAQAECPRQFGCGGFEPQPGAVRLGLKAQAPKQGLLVAAAEQVDHQSGVVSTNGRRAAQIEHDAIDWARV